MTTDIDRRDEAAARVRLEWRTCEAWALVKHSTMTNEEITKVTGARLLTIEGLRRLWVPIRDNEYVRDNPLDLAQVLYLLDCLCNDELRP